MMKNIIFITIALFISNATFSQANENTNDQYKKVYSIIVTKEGEVKHIVKQGAEINVEINGENVNGRWVFKNFPDEVTVIDKKGEIAGTVALNKQEMVKLVVPQSQSGPSIGIGVGPVSVSNLGPKFQTFKMDRYKMEIDERMETKEEKIRREYYEKQEQERLEKEAAKEAKKAAKKKGK